MSMGLLLLQYYVMMSSCMFTLYRAEDCCHGTVRLANSSVSYEGRVEICALGTWKTVCDDYWGTTAAGVVCAQLGYPRDGMILEGYVNEYVLLLRAHATKYNM